jgi:DNA-binding transcriptional ArsR family regulator
MVRGSLIEVIAEPTRRQILDELLGGELPVAALVERLQQSQPAVSKHLRVLRDARLVSVRVDGQRRMYQLQPQPLIELDTWLEPYRRMWRESLDRLEHQLSTRQSTNPRRKR